jgi:hypothetical protein
MSIQDAINKVSEKSRDDPGFMMGGGVVIAVMLLVVTFYILKNIYKTNKAKFAVICSAIFAGVFMLCYVLYLIVTMPPLPIVCRVTAEIPIKSLNLGSQVHGSFVLGFGSIDNKEYYYLYQQDGEGWIYRKLYADTWRLVEQDSLPELKTSECLQGSSIVNRTLDILVPKGTIMQQYNADVRELK